MKFDWEKFKNENIAVSFDRKEDVYDFAHEATRNGFIDIDCCVKNWIKIIDNGLADEVTVVFECIENNALVWGISSSKYYDNFIIIKWVAYPELKEGMIIEIADKQDPLWYVRRVNGVLIATNDEQWFDLDYYDDNLMDKKFPNFNIVRIYESNSYTLNNLFSKENLVLIWERKEEVEEMTLEEICKALGKKIKIKED